MSDLNYVKVGPLTAADITLLLDGNAASTTAITLDSVNMVELADLDATDVFGV